MSMIEDDVHGIQILMVQAMTFQQSRGKVALQRSKAQTVKAISFQQKPDGAIAKTAHAIVEDNWIGLEFTHCNASKAEKLHAKSRSSATRPRARLRTGRISGLLTSE